MAYEATGILIADMGTQQVSEKFRKREFVLEITEGQYPQTVKFELAQDKCDLLNGFQLQTPVTVKFDLRGRAYDKNGQTLYFTTLSAWQVAAAGQGAPQAQAPQQQQRPANANPNLQRQNAPAPNASSFISSEADNDLPF